ncbi:hypothetical protein [Flexivirga lutea]
MSAAPIRHDVVRRPLMYGAERRVIAAELAAECGGVVHRLALAQHGIDRFGIRRRGRGRPLVQGWRASSSGGTCHDPRGAVGGE